MAIGVSHGGVNTYASQAPSTEVLVGTKDGVVVLRRASSGWETAQRALPGRHISAIIIEPVTGTAFAGAFFGAVYASEDGGETWEERSEGLGFNDVYSLNAKQLPDGTVRIYAGTEPAHLFQSDDLGRHWTEVASMRQVETVDQWSFPAPPHIAHTKFIKFDPVDSNVIYACIEQGALLKSTDLGQTWKEVNTLGFYKDSNRPSEVFYDIHKLQIDPRDPQKLFVTGGAGFYVSHDGGEHWERRMAPGWAKDVYPDAFVMNPRNPDSMFMAAAEHNPARWRDAGIPGYSGSQLYRSTDLGVTWEQLTGGLPERMQEEVGGMSIEDWGDGFQLFAATTAGEVWWSENGGDSWSRIASGLGAISKKGHEMVLSSVELGSRMPPAGARTATL